MALKPWLAAERILFDPPRQREFTVTEHFRIDESRLAKNLHIASLKSCPGRPVTVLPHSRRQRPLTVRCYK